MAASFCKNLFLAAVAGSMALLLSCDMNLPYRPTQFIPPRVTVPLTSRDMIRDFIGLSHHRFKLAFTKKADQSIYVVDFSSMEIGRGGEAAAPKAYRIKNSGMPDSPLFSPDGSLITYFVRSSATTQRAYVQVIDETSDPVLVADQGTDPHFWQDSAGNLFVVYSDKFQVPLNALPGLSGYATYRQRIDPATGALIGNRETIADRPYNGGLSRSGRYLCTGYSDGAFYDRENGLLHRINYDQASGGMQICNPSISPDSAHEDWMLFLPFAGTQKLDFSAMASSPGMITMHEYLFVVDRENTVRWQRPHPSGYSQWQDPEWSNDFNFMVALAKVASNESDTRHDCFLIRRLDQGLLRLTTDDFRLDDSATPAFWISPD
ncbi:MAG: hypothetical protein JW768_02940 [Chitinispirillaceae bacterium]|nr:hypothetical protein [Chitinispirillaceae bacterium]